MTSVNESTTLLAIACPGALVARLNSGQYEQLAVYVVRVSARVDAAAVQRGLLSG
jgi:hypothetical protein